MLQNKKLNKYWFIIEFESDSSLPTFLNKLSSFEIDSSEIKYSRYRNTHTVCYRHTIEITNLK